jgi:excisionase family DNA binding protein
MEPLLTVGEVARRLRLSPDHVRRLVKSGQLHAARLGHRTVRFDPIDVEAFIAARQAKPPRVLALNEMFAALRSPDPEVRHAAALLLAYSIGSGLRLGGEHLEDVQSIIGPQVVSLLEQAAVGGDASAIDTLEKHFSAAPPAGVRTAAKPEVPA